MAGSSSDQTGMGPESPLGLGWRLFLQLPPVREDNTFPIPHKTVRTCIYLQTLVTSELFAFHTGLPVVCPDLRGLTGCWEGSRTQGPRPVGSLTWTPSSAPRPGCVRLWPGRGGRGSPAWRLQARELKLGLAGLWCLKTASPQDLQTRGCACCCRDTVEPWEARPSCLPAKALIFTKGPRRLWCLGRPGAPRAQAGCQGAQL